MPNVVIEALTCRTPVIISDYRGARDLIRHNENGIVVKRGNVVELYSAMERLCIDKEFGKKLVTNGYISASEFSKSIKDYDQLISSLLQAKGKGPTQAVYP